jgi:membrane protein
MEQPQATIEKKTVKQVLKAFAKSLLQHILLTFQFFDRNGLANHAAGGAYGFILSAAPTLFIFSIFLLTAFHSLPQAAIGLFKGDIPFLEIGLNEEWLEDNFRAVTRAGISGIVSVVSLIWAGRIFAMSLLRGLKVIFTGNKKRNPVMENLIALLIQFIVPLFALGLILSSYTAMRVYESIDFLPASILNFIFKFQSWVFPFIALGLVSYAAYRKIPANTPRPLSALQGSLFCAIPYSITTLVLRLIINKTRYNVIYGALGNIIFLLVNIFFFFSFFFLGAQFAKVVDSIDALLFTNLLKVRKDGAQKRGSLRQKLFSSPSGKLAQYLRQYQEGEVIVIEGGQGEEMFFLLEGEAEVHKLTGDGKESRRLYKLKEGTFFGEMDHLISKGKRTTVNAVTPISVLALPPGLFDDLLKNDTSVDRAVIENLSRRLKSAIE